MLDTPIRVARNGGTGRVQSNAKVEVGIYTLARYEIQEAATGSSMCCRKKLVRQCRTCIRARFDAEDIKFDI